MSDGLPDRSESDNSSGNQTTSNNIKTLPEKQQKMIKNLTNSIPNAKNNIVNTIEKNHCCISDENNSSSRKSIKQQPSSSSSHQRQQCAEEIVSHDAEIIKTTEWANTILKELDNLMQSDKRSQAKSVDDNVNQDDHETNNGMANVTSTATIAALPSSATTKMTTANATAPSKVQLGKNSTTTRNILKLEKHVSYTWQKYFFLVLVFVYLSFFLACSRSYLIYSVVHSI